MDAAYRFAIKKIFSLILFCAFILNIHSCVLYPTSRTFYEASQDDGTLINRSSCGYMNTRDSVERIVHGVNIMVSPRIIENNSANGGSNVEIFIGLVFSEEVGEVDFDQNKIYLFSNGDMMEVVSIGSVRDSIYIKKSVEVTYKLLPENENNITVFFMPESLKINETDIAIDPFRFYKVTKRDIYYGSINC